MNRDSNRDKALDALLAAAYGGSPQKDVDLETVLAALTAEERAALNDPGLQPAFPFLQSEPRELYRPEETG
jgi:hypothetical protein